MKKKVVIKLGGSSLVDSTALKELAGVVRSFREKGNDVVLVHGGGPAINQELVSRGITWRFINGQRETTPEMIDVIDRVLATDVNSMIVDHLRKEGIPSIGLSGAKDRILYCSQTSPELGLVGNVKYVETSSIDAILASPLAPLPVIAPIGYGESDWKYNVNADWAAAKIAIALDAKQLIFLTDQDGILDQDRGVVQKASPPKINAMIESGVISGGMCTKVLAMMAALEAGVGQVRVLNASAASRLSMSNASKIGSILKADRPVTRRNRERDELYGFAV